MFDPLTLIVAKAKALGLVAGTALVVTVGGGSAVAITAVSDTNDLTTDVVAEEVVESEETPELGDALVTPTITETEELEGEELEGEEVEPDVTTDLNADGLADETGLPVGFVCDDSKNHGQNVSSFASTHRGPGHGKLVSAIAKSDCGKTAEEEADLEESETEEAEVEESETEETEVEDEAMETQADEDEKAAKKADKKQKKASKAGAKGNKGGGKGNGKK